jgi:transcription antitermination factor NusG
MTPQSASFAQKAEDTAPVQAPWFAATVKPQHEIAVARSLDLRGIEQFSPTFDLSRGHQRADRRLLRRPLFPGYVFCRIDRLARTAVLQTPGVTSIVGFGGIPEPIPEIEVERVRAMVASGVSVTPHPWLGQGVRVRIHDGPLRGLEGIVVNTRDEYRLVVSVDFLRRSVSASLDRSCVAPVAKEMCA